jgi:predicted PurR-regulated permease PerM
METDAKLKLPLVARLVVIMLFVLLLYYFLITFRNFLYPVALAIMFAYLLYPVAKFFETRGVPRIPANLMAIVAGVIVLGGTAFFVYNQLRFLLADFPTLEKKALDNIDQILSQIGILPDQQESSLKDFFGNVLDTSAESLLNFLSSTAQTVFTIFIMPVYVFFLLYYRNKYFYFLMMVIAPDNHSVAERTIRDISTVVKKYMTGIFFVVLILCFVNALGLYIIGLKYALLLGIIAAVWNFIPYFGTIIGYSFPLIMALFTGDGPETAVGVVVLFIIVQFTENNILTPNITGGHVQVNPFFVILGVLIGGVVWGIPGMFIMVPTLAILRITFQNIPSLRPWAYLIGDTGTEQYAASRSNIREFFKKIFGRKTELEK